MNPWIRIFARYGVGAFVYSAVKFGLFPAEMGEQISNDPMVVTAVEGTLAACIGAVIEFWYLRDKKKGKPT